MNSKQWDIFRKEQIDILERERRKLQADIEFLQDKLEECEGKIEHYTYTTYGDLKASQWEEK